MYYKFGKGHTFVKSKSSAKLKHSTYKENHG